MDFMDLIEIPRVDNVKFYRQVISEKRNLPITQKLEGSICLTSHHLIFTNKSSADPTQHVEIWILHSLIDALEPKIRETRFQLMIRCKNFQIFFIDFPTLYCCQSVHKSLDSLSNLTSENMKFPFFSQFTTKINHQDWNLYSVEEDFNRYFADKDSTEWRISDVNTEFKVCASYPKKLIVPNSVDDQTLIKSSQFRAGGRFPSFMMRSGQPLLGSSNRRCKEDEILLKNVLPKGKKGYIFDLREARVSKNATSKGGGYETEANYPLWKRINIHLEGYEQLHNSFSKLAEACLSESNQFYSKLESSNWFYNIRQALFVSCTIADELHNKNGCVLIHGWDGSDNTLIVTSLVQILLDPECRKLKGFELLIEREWLQAGHPYSKRCFKSAFGSTSLKQEGPTFLLFLDCVRQIMDQFCISFEFNEEFLISLFDNVYASEYGTFLGNNQNEREQLCLSTRTVSFWTYINDEENLKKFLNPLYEPNDAVLWPSLFTQSLSLWSNLFLRYQINDKPFIEARGEITKMVEENKQARLKVEKLRNELIELQNKAVKQGAIG